MNFNNNCNLIISPCLCSEMAAVSVASERVVVNIFMRLRYSFRVVFLRAPLTSLLVVCCTHFNRVWNASHSQPVLVWPIDPPQIQSPRLCKSGFARWRLTIARLLIRCTAKINHILLSSMWLIKSATQHSHQLAAQQLSALHIYLMMFYSILAGRFGMRTVRAAV